MARWLVKSEPAKWSFDDQVAAGEAGTHWNGVRNHVAKRHLMAMRIGDLCLFYHSNDGRAVVGIVEVTRAYYPDHTDETGKFGMVDVRAVRPLAHVTLDRIKREGRLAEMVLVKNSRMSVQPVTEAEWDVVLELAGG